MLNHLYEHHASIFKALSDETRLHICKMIAKREVCGCEILEEVNITQPTLSYHMKLLCEAGIACGRKDGCWIRYRLNESAFLQALAYLKELVSDEKPINRGNDVELKE